ncbi:MAG: LysR family transcriptional regulator [Eubacteriaceae bacterium]|jgi:DNA-binding transcriptional LysR family regulator|nr:LysR family transcriptional regulator [Eubacteriaceae bacterium]
MTLMQMEYVIALYKEGSMNKAAKKFFISQSALSSTLKNLEEELGTTLFERSNQGLTPTSDGEYLISQISPIVEYSRNIEQRFAQKKYSDGLKLSVSCQRYPFCLQAFIKFLHSNDASVEKLRFKECDLGEVIQDVYNQTSDIGIIFISDNTNEYMQKQLTSYGIQFKLLKAIRPKVFMRKGHPLSGKDIISTEDLYDYPMVAYENGDSTVYNFSEECLCANAYDFDRLILISDRASFYPLLAETDAVSTGTGIMPETYADDRIIALPLSDQNELMNIGYIYLNGVPLPATADEYIGILKNIMECYS